MSDEEANIYVTKGAAVLVAGDALDPVARDGQWVLLGPEEIVPKDGDLTAAGDSEGNRYLRRIWSDGENWILQFVNPVRPERSVSVPKRGAGLRRIIGVLYEPIGKASKGSSGAVSEWLPSSAIDCSEITKCYAIDVEGDSLAPLARAGQRVLVHKRISRLAEARPAMLAVVETSNESVGNVIKRIFPSAETWTLVSPNPVDPIAPILLQPTEVLGVWPVRGVLFETTENAPEDAS